MNISEFVMSTKPVNLTLFIETFEITFNRFVCTFSKSTLSAMILSNFPTNFACF